MEPAEQEVPDADPLTEPLDLETATDYEYPNPAATDDQVPEDA